MLKVAVIPVSIGAALLSSLLVIGARSANASTVKAASSIRSNAVSSPVVSAHQASPSATLTAPPFSTAAANQLILAFVASDGPADGPEAVSWVSGGGLNWSLAVRSNGQAGDAEVWQAWAPAQLTNITVTARLGSGSYAGTITVAGFSSAAHSVVASASAGAPSGAPSVSLKTTTSGSTIWGVGNDWDNPIARTFPTGQSRVDQFVNTTVGDTYWTQRTTAATAPAGAMATISDSAPTSDRWNLAAVEIAPSATSPVGVTSTTAPAPSTTVAPPSTTAAPPVTTVPQPTTTSTIPRPTTTTAPPPPPPAPSTTAPPPPPQSGYPSAANTGVPAGTALTPHIGDLTVSIPGTVIDRLDISGTLTVTADNVTIMRTRVRGSSFDVVRTDGHMTKFQDVEIDGLGLQGTSGSNGIYGSANIVRTNIHSVENGVVLWSNSSMTDSYIHDLASPGSPHYDGVQEDGGDSNLVFRHNTIATGQPDQTSAIMLDNYFGPLSNVVVDNNVLSGGGYNLYADDHFNSSRLSGIQVTNNRFGQHQWGPFMVSSDVVLAASSGNVDNSTGAPLNP